MGGAGNASLPSLFITFDARRHLFTRDPTCREFTPGIYTRQPRIEEARTRYLSRKRERGTLYPSTKWRKGGERGEGRRGGGSGTRAPFAVPSDVADLLWYFSSKINFFLDRWFRTLDEIYFVEYTVSKQDNSKILISMNESFHVECVHLLFFPIFISILEFPKQEH